MNTSTIRNDRSSIREKCVREYLHVSYRNNYPKVEEEMTLSDPHGGSQKGNKIGPGLYSLLDTLMDWR